MENVLYIIPLAAILIACILFKQTGRLKAGKLVKSVVILLAAILVTQLIYYLSRILTGGDISYGMIVVTGIITDAVAQIAALFVVSILYLKCFDCFRKIPGWVWGALCACTVLFVVLYYLDYSKMIGSNGNYMDMIELLLMYPPKYSMLRKIIALIPSGLLVFTNLRQTLASGSQEA